MKKNVLIGSMVAVVVLFVLVPRYMSWLDQHRQAEQQRAFNQGVAQIHAMEDSMLPGHH